MGYERIYADQQRQIQAGRITPGDVEAFRKKRDACDSVHCLDEVFLDWKQYSADLKTRASQANQGQFRDAQQLSSRGEATKRDQQAETVAVSAQQPPHTPAIDPTLTPSSEADALQAVVSTSNTDDSSKSTSPLVAFWMIAILGVVIAQGLTPKSDRRFKTGYKNNRTVPKAVPILYGLSVIALVIGYLAR